MSLWLKVLGWIGYALIILMSFFGPILWVISGMKGGDQEAYIYKFFPAWLKWILEAGYVFWK